MGTEPVIVVPLAFLVHYAKNARALTAFTAIPYVQAMGHVQLNMPTQNT
tara:strand:- start:478 stop:624 length:147 start_codon:yes stop_codon:yes gene_type:complete